MKELKCDMLQTECDALVITTNGFVKNNGACVMGRGIAKQVADSLPKVPFIIGNLINTLGNNVALLPKIKEDIPDLIMFPVKPDMIINNGSNVVKHCKAGIGQRVAGFLAKADIQIIERSLQQLVKLANKHPEWNTILIPRVGCGAGELDFRIIKLLMENYLDDRFICCSFK